MYQRREALAKPPAPLFPPPSAPLPYRPPPRGGCPEGAGGVLRAATWACYDADRLRTDPAPDNKWQKLRTYFDGVASISPDGVLTAKKPGESVVLAILPDGSKEFFAVTVLP